MDTVLRFLGLPSFDYGPWMTKNARGLWVLRGHPSKGDAPAYAPMSARARALLERHYAPYDERLRQRFPELELPW